MNGNFTVIGTEGYEYPRITDGRVYRFSNGMTEWDNGEGSCVYTNYLDFRRRNPALPVSEMTNKDIKEVHRPAEVGEWIKIVDASFDDCNEYKNGDILRVVDAPKGHGCSGDAYYKTALSKYAGEKEYVVLENYTPESITKTIADYTDKELVDELVRRLEKQPVTAYEQIQELARFDADKPISYQFTANDGTVKELYPDMVTADVVNNKLVIEVREA